MKVIKPNRVEEIERGRSLIIYGGGVTGKTCLDALVEYGYDADCFVDDDVNKIGKKIYGKAVISLDTFEIEYIGEKTALLVGSIYAEAIVDKLSGRRFYGAEDCIVLNMKNIYSSRKNADAANFIRIRDEKFVWENFPKVYDICRDTESKKIIDVMKRVYFEQYSGLDLYDDICTREPQYFTSTIGPLLKKKKNRILDGGAFQGEIISDLIRFGIPVEKLTLFEADPDNYRKMAENIKMSSLSGVSLPVNKGLWSGSGTVYLEGEGDTCRISDRKAGKPIQVVSIDKYFQEEGIDFIKMDIEGAEMQALKGGEKTIKRDRPILAVCIYHSPEDFVGIPVYLHDTLEGYSFHILHHTNEYVESILYAVPDER